MKQLFIFASKILQNEESSGKSKCCVSLMSKWCNQKGLLIVEIKHKLRNFEKGFTIRS